MAIEFRCHQCDTLLRTGDDKAGKRAKCPNCGAMVQTPFPEGAAENAFDYEVADPYEADPFSQHFGGAAPAATAGLQSSRKIDCAMCGESIPASSRTCPFCGEPVGLRPGGPAPAFDYQGKPTSGLAVASLVLGILGLLLICIHIGLPCAILATIFGAVGIRVTRNGEREGQGMAIAGLVMGIVSLAVYALFLIAFAAAFRNAWWWGAR